MTNSISTSEENPPEEAFSGDMDAMDLEPKEDLDRASSYAAKSGMLICGRLGFGTQSTVFMTDRQSAIKVLKREIHYARERDVYLRLKQQQITKVGQFSVPRFLGCDHELWIVEMTVVKPPYVLDFASARLDQPQDFSSEVLADWAAAKEEEFGDAWGEVRAVVWAFEEFGIYLTDVRPANICVRV